MHSIPPPGPLQVAAAVNIRLSPSINCSSEQISGSSSGSTRPFIVSRPSAETKARKANSRDSTTPAYTPSESLAAPLPPQQHIIDRTDALELVWCEVKPRLVGNLLWQIGETEIIYLRREQFDGIANDCVECDRTRVESSGGSVASLRLSCRRKSCILYRYREIRADLFS